MQVRARPAHARGALALDGCSPIAAPIAAPDVMVHAASLAAPAAQPSAAPFASGLSLRVLTVAAALAITVLMDLCIYIIAIVAR